MEVLRKRSNVDLFRDITGEMSRLYISKNHDYGDSFESSCNEFGLISPVIRISDKLNRLKSLIHENPQVTDEKIEDTLIDMANYAIMSVIWLRKHDISSN